MYTKIFASIYDGSLRKNWRALVTFQQLLILSDKEGYVDMTPEAILDRTKIPEDIILPGIAELSAPDPRSRSKEEGGRRIVPIAPDRDWGWRIVNYGQYRNISTQDELRNYWRGAKKAERQKKAPLEPPPPDSSTSTLPVIIPESLNTPEFISSWTAWMEYRKSMKKTRKPEMMFALQLKELSKSPATAVQVLEQSMRNGWQGLFPLNSNLPKSSSKPPAPPEDPIWQHPL